MTSQLQSEDQDFGNNTLNTRVGSFSSSPKRFFVTNIPRTVTEHFNLEANRYAVMTKIKGTARDYLMTFQEDKPVINIQKPGKPSQRIQIKDGIAVAAFERWNIFPDEDKLKVPVEYQVRDDGLMLRIPDPFEAPVKVVREINSKEDKDEAGFTERSAWSETVQWDTEDSLARRRRAILKAKYGN